MNIVKKLISSTGVAVGIIASAGGAQAQSFDCAPYFSRGQIPESVICASPQLRQLDEEMADLYRSVHASYRAKDARVLQSEQRAWLESRNTCGFDANCLVRHYNTRIRVLKDS